MKVLTDSQRKRFIDMLRKHPMVTKLEERQDSNGDPLIYTEITQGSFPLTRWVRSSTVIPRTERNYNPITTPYRRYGSGDYEVYFKYPYFHLDTAFFFVAGMMAVIVLLGAAFPILCIPLFFVAALVILAYFVQSWMVKPDINDEIVKLLDQAAKKP
jgi:hypothetical protein